VAVLADGSFVITWFDLSGSGDTSGNGIKGQRYTASGARIDGEFLVNTTTAGSQSHQKVEALPGGGFMVTWWDQSQREGDFSSGSIRAQLFDASGQRMGSEFLVNSNTAFNQALPSLAINAQGIAMVGWQSDESGTLDVRARLFTLTQTAPISATGNAADNSLTGNAADNILSGEAGNDTIDGGLGSDTMSGGSGEDVFPGDSAGDRWIERVGEGAHPGHPRAKIPRAQQGPAAATSGDDMCSITGAASSPKASLANRSGNGSCGGGR